MQLQVDVQRASRRPGPTDRQIRRWALAALEGAGGEEIAERTQLCVRLMDDEEMEALNFRHRRRPQTANVLSFPMTGPAAGGWRHLGDIAVCAPAIEREARELGRKEEAHWAHLLVHSVLHLRGYTHEAEAEAQKMEARESAILERLGFPSPHG